MTPNEIKEQETQDRIFQHVDDFSSFRFSAGAGAGKTYALIETPKYVTTHKITATNSPQKVACITYTNVAVNEIKSRLGNSDAVEVSTIHDRLWGIIKRHQPQLLICHKDKVEESLKENEQKLYGSEKAQFFINLTKDQKQEFIEYVEQTKEVFYQSKKLRASPFKSAYIDNADYRKPEFLEGCLTPVDKFKYVVGLLYEVQRLKGCLDRIDSGKEIRVEYDSKVNTDRLHKMKFSHDTLLEYGLTLIESYPTLCRIVIDIYPYFFIDEYQDTHPNVIKFVKAIHDYAIECKKDWVVGYFGDSAQAIYDDGVGRCIDEIHAGLTSVNKIFNRRSHQQIIDVANKIRDDEIVQEPIFDNCNTGSVHFFYNSSENNLDIANKFLIEYKNDLVINNNEMQNIDGESATIHCLVLTNKLMAEFNGFGDVYGVYQNSIIYYDNLKTQVLSQELEKLHSSVLTIYHLVKLYQDIQECKVSYYDVFGAASKNTTFSKASLVIHELKKKRIALLKDWVDLIIEQLGNNDIKHELAKALINYTSFEPDKVTAPDVFEQEFLDSINTLMNDGSEENANEKIDRVLELPITSLIRWVNFIDGVETGDIVYHTYHGTKGEEYENVAIILEHSFGSKNRDKFKNYFNVVQAELEERKKLLDTSEKIEKHINTQNLLYVACSRAIKNLRVLYLDDISEIEKGVNTIFGESKLWPITTATTQTD